MRDNATNGAQTKVIDFFEWCKISVLHHRVEIEVRSKNSRKCKSEFHSAFQATRITGRPHGVVEAIRRLRVERKRKFKSAISKIFFYSPDAAGIYEGNPYII